MSCPICCRCKLPIMQGQEARGRNITPWSLRTKGEVFSDSGNWQSARTAIRKHANQVFLLSNRAKRCEVCGYSNHFEICHIKPVASFEDQATLAEINADTNLVALCPNHHWELDNGLLNLVSGLGVAPSK